MKFSFPVASFQELLYRLVSKATADTQGAALVEAPASTRFPVVVQPITRTFLEAQAKALGGSMAGLAGALLDGFVQSEIDTSRHLATIPIQRLMLLIKEHGLSMPAAAEVLSPFGIGAVDLSNDDRLLAKLTVNSLQKIADHFHVNYDWLTGKNGWPTSFQAHTWYKCQLGIPEEFMRRADTCEQMELIVVRVEGIDYDSPVSMSEPPDLHEAKVPRFIPVLAFTYRVGDSERYTTYKTLDEGRWSYWRCREHLKMVVYFVIELARVKRMRVAVRGRDWPLEKYLQFARGDTLAVSTMQDQRHNAAWHPDDYVEPWSAVAKDKAEWSNIFNGEQYKSEFAKFKTLLEAPKNSAS